jgi:hypothetical protein
LNNAIRKHGNDNFIVELIEICEVSKLNDREIYFIDKYNSQCPNGYNLTKGGQTLEQIKVDIDILSKLDLDEDVTQYIRPVYKKNSDIIHDYNIRINKHKLTLYSDDDLETKYQRLLNILNIAKTKLTKKS